MQQPALGDLAEKPAGDVVVLDRVHMVYRDRPVFTSLSCGFVRGRISVILGGSGSGKTTILRLIGGLVRPESGAVLVDGQDISRLSALELKLMRRKLGMTFQGGSLLDSYSVFDNVALPLREQPGYGERQIADEVHAILKAVDVADADNLLPGELSGGMLRRVALARAIIRKPAVLLCDEPFSGLDPISIRRMATLLMDINRQFGITMIVVSHDIHSTMRMADHVLLLLGGRMVEGTPAELRQSGDAEAAEFFQDGLDRQPGRVR
ncbi:MAG TPA: ATP-binding cassette domain-containing protein [Tepidisphaeraceae bacterium]|nr:ATP-binding cassette domain-containing protein [Tepidisphaeraceae bacterium]